MNIDFRFCFRRLFLMSLLLYSDFNLKRSALTLPKESGQRVLERPVTHKPANPTTSEQRNTLLITLYCVAPQVPHGISGKGDGHSVGSALTGCAPFTLRNPARRAWSRMIRVIHSLKLRRREDSVLNIRGIKKMKVRREGA